MSFAENSAVHIRRGLSWIFLEKISRMGITLIMMGWVARYLKTHDLGVLQYSLSYLALWGFLSLPGLDAWVIKKIIHAPEKQPEIFAAVLFLKILGAVLIGIGITLTVFFTNWVPRETRFLVMMLAFSGVANFCSFADLWFQSELSFGKSSVSKQIGLYAGHFSRCILILVNASVNVFFVPVWVENVFTSLAQGGLFFRKSKRSIRWREIRKEASELIFEGWPLIVISGLVLFYSKVDSIILARSAGFVSVGEYACAQRLLEMVNTLPMSVSAVMVPLTSHIFKDNQGKNKNQEEHELSKWLGWVHFVSLPVTIFTLAMAPFLIRIIFGNDYSESVVLFRILVLGLPPVFFSVIRHSWLISQELQGDALKFEIIVALLVVMLNLFLVPRYGAIGSAIATVCSIYLSNILACIWIPSFKKCLWIYLQSLRRIHQNMR